MNAYDFDKTIFYPDSSACFFRFCLKKHPGAVLRVLPAAVGMFISYRKKQLGAKELKQQLFSFLGMLNDTEQLVAAFWEENFSRIGDWYLRQKRGDDVIISASPRFLLEPVCQRLGVELIATEMDIRSGRISGPNCHDAEKPKRFYALHPGARPEAFYSDSLSDAPMAEISEKAYLVKKYRLSPWPEKE